jgi:hypothetical protein
LLEHLASHSDHLPADADELAVFGNQLVVVLRENSVPTDFIGFSSS